MKKKAGLCMLFVLIAFLPSVSAVFVDSGGWYAAINKPAWTPPPWLFGPVWTLLYLMIGLSGYVAWTCGGPGGRRAAFAVYGAQLVLNAMWTPLFFGLHRPGWALADLVLLWVTVLFCMALFARRRRLAAGLLFPYWLWISFAGGLNGAILMAN
jgi:tryptophan-rich sensory protein